jgi:hypothetical protein
VGVDWVASELADRAGAGGRQVIDDGDRQPQQDLQHVALIVSQPGDGRGHGGRRRHEDQALFDGGPHQRVQIDRRASGEGDEGGRVQHPPADHDGGSPRSRRTASRAY